MITRQFGIPVTSPGAILRREKDLGTPLGLETADTTKHGGLVSDKIIVELIEDWLRLHGGHGFVFDGFPRTIRQAEALDGTLREIGRELTVVFALQVPDEICVERLLGRATIEGRPDDTPEAIRKRLEIYHRETEPVIEHYRTQGILVTIHGEERPNKVFAEIQAALEQVAVR